MVTIFSIEINICHFFHTCVYMVLYGDNPIILVHLKLVFYILTKLVV